MQPPGFSDRVSSRSLHITLRELQLLQIQLLPPANSKQFRKANNTYTQYRRVIGTVTEPGTVLKCNRDYTIEFSQDRDRHLHYPHFTGEKENTEQLNSPGLHS